MPRNSQSCPRPFPVGAVSISTLHWQQIDISLRQVIPFEVTYNMGVQELPAVLYACFTNDKHACLTNVPAPITL